MRAWLLAAGLLMAFAVARAAPSLVPAEPPPGDLELVELLSGIDYVPTRGSLDAVLGAGAAAELAAIAGGEGLEGQDPGVRMRAYRALALYPGAAAESALRDAISAYAGQPAGIDTLYLRAATASLVEIAGGDAVDDLAPLLDHASRDVRATAAAALGDTGSNQAISPLRARLSVEEVGQVRLAIAEALRALE